MRHGVGILGFAHGHVGSYIAQWREHPEYGVDVVAAWDHDAARLEKNATPLNLRQCASPEALLADPAVTAVVVSAETSRHADLAEQAAAAGKAIIVQKPIALTVPQADRVVAAVKRAKVPFTMAWQMRVDPQNLKMKELLASGEFGRVFQVRRRHCLGAHLWGSWFLDSWHVSPTENRDIWADDASHAVDFIHWLLGVPETVTAEIASLWNAKMPMDNGMALYRYADGPVAEVSSSFTCVAGENTTEIVAEKGTIIQNYGDGPSCGVPRAATACGLKWFMAGAKDWVYSDIASPPGHGPRIAGLALPLAEFLNGARPAIATAEEGRMSLRMTLACHLSTRQGRRVSINDPAIDGL
jgi:predicted dehydrogenase